MPCSLKESQWRRPLHGRPVTPSPPQSLIRTCEQEEQGEKPIQQKETGLPQTPNGSHFCMIDRCPIFSMIDACFHLLQICRFPVTGRRWPWSLWAQALPFGSRHLWSPQTWHIMVPGICHPLFCQKPEGFCCSGVNQNIAKPCVLHPKPPCRALLRPTPSYTRGPTLSQSIQRTLCVTGRWTADGLFQGTSLRISESPGLLVHVLTCMSCFSLCRNLQKNIATLCTFFWRRLDGACLWTIQT